jgi:hypothetical protein
MKKLVYILILLAISGCTILSGIFDLSSKRNYEKYGYYNDMNNFYENYHWSGVINSIDYKLIIDSVNKHRIYSKIIFQNESISCSGIQKGGVWYSYILTDSNIRAYPINKFYVYNRLSDTLILKNDTLNHLNFIGKLILTKRENEYFQPYHKNSLINYQKDTIGWRLKIELKNSSSIIAVKKGEITRVNKRNGQHIIVKHENGLSSMYATKYSKIKVKEGDIIEKGEVIGITESNKWDIVNFSFLLMKDRKRINPLLIFE